MDNANRTISIKEEIKIHKLKVKVGTMIYDGAIILIYESIKDPDNGPGSKQKKLKSSEVGIVRKILVKEGDIIPAGFVSTPLTSIILTTPC